MYRSKKIFTLVFILKELPVSLCPPASLSVLHVNVQVCEQGYAYRGKGKSQVPSLASSSYCLNPGTLLTEWEAHVQTMADR